jgi:hypothetical protein
MKELQQKESEPTISISQDIKKQVKFIGSQRKVKGLIMFELNPISMTLEPAKYKESVVRINKTGPNTIAHQLIVKEGCYYIQALNKKNAYKKIAKSHKLIK